VLFALLVGLLCAEAGLRIAGAAYLAWAGSRAPAAGDGRVLLCLGDSNVFGLYERPADAYPAQLQALLDAGADGRWRVENGGRPGASSLDVARRIDGELRRARPSAVLLTVGVNDQWSYAGGEGVDAPWYEELRLTKLARLLAARLAGGAAGQDQLSVPEGLPVRNADFAAELARNLRLIRERCLAHGAPLLLVAYSTDRPVYAEANAILRELARDEGFALADATADVAELERELGFEQVFHLDLHPRAPAYRRIALACYAGLRALGVVSGAAAPAPAPDAAGPSVTMHLLGRADGGLTLEIEGGLPQGAFSVILFGLRDAGAPAPTELAELAGDPLLRLTLNRPDLRGVFDAEGRASVSLGQILGVSGDPRLAGQVLQAAYLQHADGDLRRITGVPPAVTLALP
jgi:lysophospholipase L1-like esterase